MKIGLNEPFGIWRWGLNRYYGYEILFLEELAQRIYLVWVERTRHIKGGYLMNPRCAIERQNK